jgi:carbamoyltransferase
VSFVLGINAHHGDASARLLAEGRVVAAAVEERCRRIKRGEGFPSEAIKHCRTGACIRLTDVAHIADEQALCEQTAHAISEGKVVG